MAPVGRPDRRCSPSLRKFMASWWTPRSSPLIQRLGLVVTQPPQHDLNRGGQVQDEWKCSPLRTGMGAHARSMQLFAWHNAFSQSRWFNAPGIRRFPLLPQILTRAHCNWIIQRARANAIRVARARPKAGAVFPAPSKTHEPAALRARHNPDAPTHWATKRSSRKSSSPISSCRKRGISDQASASPSVIGTTGPRPHGASKSRSE
jgi:hypothetical protein